MSGGHDSKLPSGRFVLRIEAGLHAALRRAASAAGLSLNAYCARMLAGPVRVAGLWEGAAEVIERAAAICGASLLGVVVFGSWAREEQREGSDVDVLVVVDRVLPITRELYRQWDAVPISWEGHAVEAHLVRLPAGGRAPSGLWAEVAIDGLLLFATSWDLPSYLAKVRRWIAEGRIVRRVANGQPYWVEAA
jgi:hypothetical protein